MIRKNDDMKIIVFLAFIIVAVGYFIYILNKPKEQQPTTRQPDYQPPSQDPCFRVSQPTYTETTPPAPIKPVVKNLLILVVPVSQQSIVESIRTKGQIDYEDSETLYQVTQLLCQDTEPNLSHELASLDQFQVVEASEYDIYLITIELNQADEGFNKNVNQLERYDAFRNLANLAKTIRVSPRLQMEAYEIFNVYNR
jgi:hypothetical protein